MRINVVRVPRMSIQEFADKYGLSMTVQERRSSLIESGLARYFAHFDYVEVKDGSMLISGSGNGPTIETAIMDYCDEISNKLLVYRATASADRREITAPELYVDLEKLDKETA